jgi:hypothetical protein
MSVADKVVTHEIYQGRGGSIGEIDYEDIKNTPPQRRIIGQVCNEILNGRLNIPVYDITRIWLCANIKYLFPEMPPHEWLRQVNLMLPNGQPVQQPEVKQRHYFGNIEYPRNSTQPE